MTRILLPAFFLIFILVLPSKANHPQQDQLLFLINRSVDRNEVHYVVNLDKSGFLDKHQPVKVFWVKHEEKGQREPLTRIQNKFSYGLEFIHVDREKATFRIIAQDQLFEVSKGANGRFRAVALKPNAQVVVERIFVQIDGGSFLVPKVSKVEIKGFTLETGKYFVEALKP
ncbi:MAG: DUF4833 domain-containing protein [Bacteroidales bacterium]|nr:DUF4833 domain-containing protein [Bacteroidales bacterium]